MSAERTQAPSRLRRQQARDAGHAPHSPELTAAAGLLAALIMLGAWGGELGAALRLVITEGITSAVPSPDATLTSLNDPTLVAAQFHRVVAILALPLGSILFGTLVAMIAVHQAQTGGLWAPARLAPDFSRLWKLGSESDDELNLAAPFVHGLGALFKLAILVLIAACLLIAQMPALENLAKLELPALLLASTALVRAVALPLAIAGFVLGLVDFGLRHRRFEEHLRLTPNQQREEQKAIDGDPAIRSRRLQTARAWRQDPAELLVGASLVVTGTAGLTVLLGGSPPPGQVSVRTIARGVAASRLRQSAERAGLKSVKAPELARWFAASRTTKAPLPPYLATELASLWSEAEIGTQR